MLALTRKDNSSALSLLEQSMELFNRLGDIWGKGRVSQLLGELALRQGDLGKARFFFEQNLRFDEELKFKPGMVVALSNLGNLQRYQSQYDQARQYFEKSLEVSRIYGIKETWGLGLYSLGLVALQQNNYSVAKQNFAEHFKTYSGSFNQVSLGTLFLSQAAISAGTNQLERAARLSGAAQVTFEKLDYRISRFDAAEFDRHIQKAREQLGTGKFENLANEGRLMTIEQAIAYALEDAEN
jgi:tetratricopeptide (TPR) repeat protein